MTEAPEKRTIPRSLRDAWAMLERRVDEGVRSAVARVRQPIVAEIAQLRGRVERLQRSLEELRRRREGKG